jgi:ribosomal protein S18 acetylase RimI-like enzyme
MTMDATIAVATHQDRDVLVALLAAQLHEHHITLSSERLAAAVDGALHDAVRGLFLLARVQGTAVGAAYLSFNWTLEHGGKSCWLEELYVMPAYRERGIGRQLLDAVCQRAAELGCAAIDLEVEEEHARAQHLYEREGFHPHRRHRWVRLLRDEH